MSDIQKNRIEKLEQDVDEYDEVHVYIAGVSEGEEEEKKDFRSKDAEFDHDACLVTIEDGVTFYRVAMEQIIYWTPPRDF